jgi:hypothetical protein
MWSHVKFMYNLIIQSNKMTNHTKIVVTTNEYMSCLPLGLLAVFYFITDILTFNRLEFRGRLPVLNRLQVRVLFLLYPIWVVFSWFENMSTRHGAVLVLTFIGLVNTIVFWLARTLVLNNNTNVSTQQWCSLITITIISSLWRWNNLLMFSQ